MPSERDFLQQRLQRIEKHLEQVREFNVDEKGRFYVSYQNIPMRDNSLIREARLLEKLLVQVEEGNISRAISQWRKNLSEKLRLHREHYRPLQEEYDRWLSLPFPIRIDIPEPIEPPDLEIMDSQGREWVIDELLLGVFDDVFMRLKKWLETDDE